MSATRTAALAALLLVAGGAAGATAGPPHDEPPPAPRTGADADAARAELRGDGGRVTVGRGGVLVEGADGSRISVGPGGEVRLTDGPPEPPVPGEVTGPGDFAETPGVPGWAADPPPGRLAVAGPLETDAETAKYAAGVLAAEALAEAAGVPAAAVRGVHGVERFRRLSAVEPVVRDTGENTFTVYRARLLLDVEPASLEFLRRAHRRAVSDGRAGVAAGAAGALAGLCGAVWGVGRRKLKRG